MDYSINTLTINKLSVEPIQNNESYLLKGTIEAQLDCCCPKTGNVLLTIELSSTDKQYDQQSALRSCIQNFIDGKIEYKYKERHVNSNCYLSKETHNIQVLMPEPYLSLLFCLLDKSFTLPKEIFINGL